MQIVLALAWRPDASMMARFDELYPKLMRLYAGISVVVPPDTNPAHIDALNARDGVKVSVSQQMVENRRYLTICQALDFQDAGIIHYSDGDHALARLLRFPDDYRRMLAAMDGTDCLIVGRSESALKTYPQPLRDTEAIINVTMSHVLGQPVDLGSGSRGFSRQAVKYIVEHDTPESHPIAVDASWPVMLHRAGFAVTTYASCGAVYEIRDETHRALLESPEQWQKRVHLAHEILTAGFEAIKAESGPI